MADRLHRSPATALVSAEPAITRQAKNGSPDKPLADAECAHDLDQAAQPYSAATWRDGVAKYRCDQGPRTKCWSRLKLVDEGLGYGAG